MMADPIDIQYLQDKLAEMIATSEELVAEHNELLKVYRALVTVGQTGQLGDLGLVDSLSEAPIGDRTALQTALQIQNVAGRGVVGTGSEIMLRGADGFGATDGQLGTSGNDFDAKSPNASLKRYSVSNVGGPNSGSAAGHYLEMPWSPNGAMRLGTQFFGARVSDLWTQNRGSDGWEDFIYYRSTQNTAFDTNGFLKSASPILRLANDASFATSEKEGFVAAGSGAANSEASGVVASHDDVGVYTVTGSLGITVVGEWATEVPRDQDGNAICLVRTEQDGNGVITVRTFAKKMSPETGDIVPGEPLDLPDGRWLDIKLRMPEQPGDEYPDGAPAPELTPEEQEQRRLDQLQRWRETTAVSAFQAHQAIADFELMDEVESYLARDNTPEKTRRAWLMAQEFRRLSPTVLEIAEQLGMTAEQLDEVFLHALTIEA